ncbi:MAG: hypothetical protein LBC61_04260 [Candidatus Peribacteria bacterium]|nr:hypothetical protein [Candidatus Peribacteria bacterium]
MKSESAIQIANISPKPFIIFIQNTNKIKATKSPVKFESQIADQDSLNQKSVESKILYPSLNFSLTLSNINIFASIAIQMDNITQAIEAIVSTIQNIFTIAKSNIAYIKSAIEAISPASLYVRNKKTKISKNPEIQATISFHSEEIQILLSIVFSLVK